MDRERAYEVGGKRLILLLGDITQQAVDAIVNAANSGLRGGGGVDGAIHRAAGPTLLEECRALGECPTGGAIVTGAGNLESRHVIHAVGPRWQGGDAGEDELLESAYRQSMKRADALGLETIAFPSLSTGAYRFPVERAASLALAAIADLLARSPTLQEVRFVLFDEVTFAAYESAADELL